MILGLSTQESVLFLFFSIGRLPLQILGTVLIIGGAVFGECMKTNRLAKKNIITGQSRGTSHSRNGHRYSFQSPNNCLLLVL
jgi:hypothetical protein